MAAQKSKGMLYGLGFLVLGIWGLVIYRLFSAVQSNESIRVTGSLLETAARPDLPSEMPDTFKLMLSYSDPFTGEEVPERPSRPVQAITAQHPVPIQYNPLDQVRYLGFVAAGRNASHRLAIISINGQDHLMKTGDMLKGMKVLEVGLERLRLQYKNKIQTFKTE